jgi:hypothetical protein
MLPKSPFAMLFYLANIGASCQSASYSLCQNIMHWISWVQAVEPEVLINRYETAWIE